MATRALQLLLAFAVFTTSAFADSPSENFRACFRWNNATQNFQGGDDWYNSHACQQWFWQAFGFAIPAVIGGIVLLVFPVIFYVSRIFCNCCGGRHRSYGMCCADDSSRHRFPGYPNRSIFLAKMLMCIVFGFYTYYAVGAYVSNARFHNDIIDGINDLGTSVNSVNVVIQRSASAVDALASSDYVLAPRTLADYLRGATSSIADGIHDIHHVLDKIRDAENNNSYGRASSVYRYPSCVLFCLLLIIVLMAFNVRKAMGPLMVLVCLTSIVEGCVFVPHMILAQGVTAMCHNYNETVVPVVVGVIEKQNGCNDPTVTLGLTNVANDFEALAYHVSGRTPGSLCSAMREVCAQQQCAFNTCGGAHGTTLQFRTNKTASPFDAATFGKAMTTPFVGGSNNILDCAVGRGCVNGTDAQLAAATLAKFYRNEYVHVEYLLDTVYPDSYECRMVRGFLAHPLHDDVCTDLDRHATNVAMVTGVLYLISFLSLPVIIRGMKRFVPLQRNQSVAEVAKETVWYADARANAATYRQAENEPTYGTINTEGASAVQLADAAYHRRFGPNVRDGADQPLVTEHDAAAPGDVKPV